MATLMTFMGVHYISSRLHHDSMDGFVYFYNVVSKDKYIHTITN